MKQVRTKEQIVGRGGSIPKGSLYNWNEDTNFYEHKQDGVVVSTINEPAVEAMSSLFEKV